ncbi:MAG: NUDIX hydrolase [Desulfohalobiaceae bacterium]|nr:NUDIX hydrolase [Desulfohalobiaceae bacterium]
MAVGGVVVHKGRVLLVKRGQEPSLGRWSIPGGRVELGETIEEAVEREIREETGVVVKAGQLVYHFETIERDESGRIRFHYLILDLRAGYVSGDPSPGGDAAAAGWFRPEDLQRFQISKRTLYLLKSEL